ncbi:hypothetical protein AK830_g8108 [Neonectria ditissima]|uniref:Transcription factor domain-containing protein n=1 Tax=Neonectria ditissima TaxID=78410 RepID=A0A0P7BEY3_9HYPO|nr:hypothetical protein AK830_g8108 [Neonectria ditissima]
METVTTTPEDQSPAPADQVPEQIPYFSKFLHDIQRDKIEDWTLDMELLHHYTITAHRTFTFWGEVHHTLQADVPRQGLEHTFLLQQILAFSGFHLAYTQPDRRRFYALRAAQHQDKAISDMRAALAREVTSHNCHALYASSIFLIFSAFATFPSYEVYNSSFSALDSLIDILKLVDGISLMIKISEHDLRGGPLKGLFAGKTGPISTSSHLQTLVDRLLSLETRFLAQHTEQEGNGMGVVKEATELLADSILSVHRSHSVAVSLELRAAFHWPLRLSDEYLDLLRGRDPIAMVVLAHYCVLLHYAESTCWFLEGWSKTTIQNIANDLSDSPLQDLIEWPLSITTT